MDEIEFDRKIKESAMLHESRIEKPLWNKEGVWNRIDSGLEKKNRSVWWKAAAVILVLFSAGWSFAQWSNFRQYRLDKESELCELNKRLYQNTVNKIREEQIIIRRQNRELDSLKRQIDWLGEINRKRESTKLSSGKNEVAENREKPDDQEKLIDSLQNLLKLAQKTISDAQLARLSEEKKTAKPENTVNSKEISTESHIYYISNHNQPQNLRKGGGFKINFLESSEKENIEYQSDHSIFKKQKP